MSEENIYTFENETYRKTYWHTCSHVLAQAVKRLWPTTKLAITIWTASRHSPQRIFQRSRQKCARSVRKS